MNLHTNKVISCTPHLTHDEEAYRPIYITARFPILAAWTMHPIQVMAPLPMSAVRRPLLSATQDAMKQSRKQLACSVNAMLVDRFACDIELAAARWYFLMFLPIQLVVQFHIVSACGANCGVCEEGLVVRDECGQRHHAADGSNVHCQTAYRRSRRSRLTRRHASRRFPAARLSSPHFSQYGIGIWRQDPLLRYWKLEDNRLFFIVALFKVQFLHVDRQLVLPSFGSS